MATTIKKRRSKSGGAGIRGCGTAGNAESAPPAANLEYRNVIHSIPVDQIDPSPFQPRSDFGKDELRQMADSIIEHGLQVPITVRPGPFDPDRFELVFGERRLRAVKLARQENIIAQVREYTDSEVRQLILIEVLQRKGLNAIEEARAFQAAIDCGDAAGPTELAKQLGLSQGHVSNRLRLLELPERIQSKVISREISPTNARSLVPLKDAPAVLDIIIEETEERADGQELNCRDFLDIIDDAVFSNCRQINSDVVYDPKHQCKIPKLKLTDEQRESLGIITHARPWPNARQLEYATNTELYDQMWETHKAAAIERAKKKNGKGAEKGREESGEGRESKKPLTAAEKKRAAEEEKHKAKERAGKLARGVWHVAIGWQRRLISRVIAGEEAGVAAGVAAVGISIEDVLLLLLFLGSSAYSLRSGANCATNEMSNREDALASVVGAKQKGGSPALWKALAAIPNIDAGLDFANEYLAKRFWNPDWGGEAFIADEDVLAIAEHLGIDFAAAWKRDALGEPHTQGWLELRTKDQLAELAKEWRVEASGSKSEMIAALAAVAHKQKPPAELVKPKKPRD